MRLAVCVAILGELPALRDKMCVPRENVARHGEKQQSPAGEQRTILRVQRAINPNG